MSTAAGTIRSAPQMVDYDGLGMRIPMLVVSAVLEERGFVSHVLYEHGSILRFIEDEFGLARLAASDSRANSIARRIASTSTPRRAPSYRSKHRTTGATSSVSRPTTIR